MATEGTLRYLKLDYQSHKDALLQRVRERWPNAWNDFLSNSFGMVLVDLVAWGTSTLAFLVNRTASENFISTMTLRESAVRIGSLVGYQLRGPVPATVSCEATLSTAQTADVTITESTLIRTSDTAGLPFEVVEDYTIEAGELTPKTLVVILSPSQSGSQVINSSVQVTTGSVNVDLIDTTITLSDFIQAGQSFNVDNSTDVYTITSIEASPGGVSSSNRMVLDRPYEGSTEVTDGEVYDLRIQLIQGQTIVDRFVAPATDTNSYSVRLSRVPVIDNSVLVTVNGEPWTAVNNVGLSGEFDTIYQVKTLTNGQTLVLFGDGNFGEAVPLESAIEVTYRIGGGTDGNIDLNTINTSITGLIESFSNPVPVIITNQTSTGQGGQNAETLDQARVNIPAYARTNDRAVTLQDYQTVASQYSDPQHGAVAYARSTIRTENSFLEGNIVAIYAWTTGNSGGLVPLTPQLKQALSDYMETKAMGTDLVQIFDGSSRPIPLSLRFQVFSGFDIATTQNLLLDTIRDFVNSLVPGQPILYSNLVRALDEVFGVDTINMATPIADLYPSNTTELFTEPQDTFVYDIARNGDGNPEIDDNGDTVSPYTAQLPIFPLAVWSLRLFLGEDELTIVPDVEAGFARLLGENLSSDIDNQAYWSRVNLLTGQVTLWLVGAPGDFTMQLVTVDGYSVTRPIDVFIGYTGDNTNTKRDEIRSALRAWSDGLTIGGSMYGVRVENISASTVSIEDVVAFIDGVDAVSRVALDTPANNAVRVTSSDNELLRIGNIYLNNQVD